MMLCAKYLNVKAIYRPGTKELAVHGERPGWPDGGRADEPVHDVQDPGDRPAGLPPRRARPDQHPPGAADRGVAARPLAGAPPGRRRRDRLTVNRIPGPSGSPRSPAPWPPPRGKSGDLTRDHAPPSRREVVVLWTHTQYRTAVRAAAA